MFVKSILGPHKKHTFKPGGSVIKNLPANATDMGPIPDPGRSHMEQLSPSTRTSEPILCNKRSPRSEKLTHN